jgi:hypothetical protein
LVADLARDLVVRAGRVAADAESADLLALDIQRQPAAEHHHAAADIAIRRIVLRPAHAQRVEGLVGAAPNSICPGCVKVYGRAVDMGMVSLLKAFAV